MAANMYLLQAMKFRRLDAWGERDAVEAEMKERRRAKNRPHQPPVRGGRRPEEQYEGESARGRTTPGMYDHDKKDVANIAAAGRMMRHLLIKFTCGDAPIDQTPHQLLQAAATVNRLVHEELVDKAALIEDDDPDRRYIFLSLKLEFIQALRKDRDRHLCHTENRSRKERKTCSGEPLIW